MAKRLLIIFVRNPLPGKVKTRLAATIGDRRALEIYQKLLEHTAATTRSLPVDKVVFYSDFIEENDLWDGTMYRKQVQNPGDLGDRINSAFEWGFQSGYGEICLIGSDCHELTPEIIMQGFEELGARDAVLGPSRDGGYYLLGLKQIHSTLFQGKQWGTDTVARETLADFKSLGLSSSLLRPLNDIDVEEDLDGFEF
jgi:rSAM/selenodomain-associated transferase 1